MHKRGNQKKAENYRDISLLCSAYKIYAEILRKRLEKKIKDKGMIPISQVGFRKKKSTLDITFIF